MRIFWYGKWEPVDGNHVYLKSLSKRQSTMGHEVFVSYFGNAGTNRHDRDPSTQYLPLPYIYKSQPWVIHHPSTHNHFRGYLIRHKPDLVHASLAVSTFDLSLGRICKELGIPWIITFHISFANHLDPYSLFSYFNYLFYRRTLISARKVIIFSERQKRFAKVSLGMSGENLEVIPNGVDRDLYCPGPSIYRKGLEANFVVGYLGRLAPEKKIATLCHAFLEAGLPGSKLLIIGDGVSKKKIARKYGRQPSIIIAGPVMDEEKKIDMIRAMDCFVLPSSIEGLSISLLEAMSCGVAPVVTDVGGHADVVEGSGVCLEPRGLMASLTKTLRELWKNRDRLDWLGKKAREKVESSYDWQENLQQVENLYKEISF